MCNTINRQGFELIPECVIDKPLRVAILSPFQTASLRDFIPSMRDASAVIPSGMGGPCIVNLVRERLRRGLPTDIITLSHGLQESFIFFDGGLARLWIVRRRARKALRDGYREEIKGLQHALRQSEADVCHANWTYEYGLASVTQEQIPVVLTVHDHALHVLRWSGLIYLPHYFMTGYVIKRARYITTVSPYVADYLEHRLGRKISVVPNLLSDLVWNVREAKDMSSPTDGLPVPDIQFSPSDTLIVSALNWSKLKNVKRALKAFKLVRNSLKASSYRNIELCYLLMGPRLEYKGPAWQWAVNHDCAENVAFRGTIPYTETLKTMAEADIVFHPSLEESFGMPVAEAMALGVPVVAAKEAGGSRWLLEGGKCGILVSGYSVNEMADGLARALDIGEQNTETIDRGADAGKRINEQVERANARIRDIGEPDVVLKAYDEIYRKCLNFRSN